MSATASRSPGRTKPTCRTTPRARRSRTWRPSAGTSGRNSWPSTGRATGRSTSRPTRPPTRTTSRPCSWTARWTSPSNAFAYNAEAARAFNDALVRTLDACTADEVCAADVEGGDALDAYDALAARLLADPIDFDFPKADGTTEIRALTLTDLEKPPPATSTRRPDASSSSARSLPRRARTSSRSPASPTTRSSSIRRRSRRSRIRPTRTRCTTPSNARTTRSCPERGDPDARLAGWLNAGARGRRERPPPRDRLLRRSAVPLLAGPARERRRPAPITRSALPDLRPDVRRRPGDPDRERDADLLAAHGRLLHRPDRWLRTSSSAGGTTARTS